MKLPRNVPAQDCADRRSCRCIRAYQRFGFVHHRRRPVASGISNYTSPSTLDSLTFTIGGQTFNLAGGTGNTLVRFLNGQLNNITFAQQVGAPPNRLALQAAGGYVLYYNNLQSASYGTFTSVQVASASPVPERGFIALLGTGLLGGAATLYRRFAPNRLS